MSFSIRMMKYGVGGTALGWVEEKFNTAEELAQFYEQNRKRDKKKKKKKNTTDKGVNNVNESIQL